MTSRRKAIGTNSPVDAFENTTQTRVGHSTRQLPRQAHVDIDILLRRARGANTPIRYNITGHNKRFRNVSLKTYSPQQRA